MSYHYINYLFSCDYVYKQNLNKVNSKRRIDNVRLFISLDRVKKEVDPFNLLNTNIIDYQLKTFFIFFLDFFAQPSVKYLAKNNIGYLITFSFSRGSIKKFFIRHINLLYHIFDYLLLIKFSDKKVNVVFNSFFCNTFFAKQSLQEFFLVAGFRNLSIFFSCISK